MLPWAGGLRPARAWGLGCDWVCRSLASELPARGCPGLSQGGPAWLGLLARGGPRSSPELLLRGNAKQRPQAPVPFPGAEVCPRPCIRKSLIDCLRGLAKGLLLPSLGLQPLGSDHMASTGPCGLTKAESLQPSPTLVRGNPDSGARPPILPSAPAPLPHEAAHGASPLLPFVHAPTSIPRLLACLCPHRRCLSDPSTAQPCVGEAGPSSTLTLWPAVGSAPCLFPVTP